MIRSGRFRHRLLDDIFLQTHAGDLHRALTPFLDLWHRRQISDAEMAALYIFIFSFFRRPQDFLGGPHNDFVFKKSSATLSGLAVLEELANSLPPSLRQKKSLQRIATKDVFLDLFCSLSWRSIPLSVPRSLMAWQTGLYALTLTTEVPTPEEVLELQCQSRRCVSMLTSAEHIAGFVEEGRDVLGFIVHDLIHADHFFADPLKTQAQVLFCQRLKKVYETAKIQEILKKDAFFKAEFFYLMSDMNSVPLHLLKTLKAVLLGHFKRRQKAFNQPLSPADEAEFLALFQEALKAWSFSPEAWQAALRLNTPLAQGPQDLLLLDVALNKLS